jgi:hypothetical protein
MPFTIEVVPHSFTVDSVEPVFVSGEVWVTVGGHAFPGERWVDAPISVVGTLGSAAEAIRGGEPVDMYFFEGPYFVKLSPAASFDVDRMVRVTALKDYWDEAAQDHFGEIIADAFVSLGKIEETYQKAVTDMIFWAEENGQPELLSRFRKMSR